MKVLLEIVLAVCFVVFGTLFVYSKLSHTPLFWNEQSIWSAVLVLCWLVVSLGYIHQGWVVKKANSAVNVSLILPLAVFIVQCILFVKGVFYKDWSLIVGALLVNSAVTFNVYQIIRARIENRKQ